MAVVIFWWFHPIANDLAESMYKVLGTSHHLLPLLSVLPPPLASHFWVTLSAPFSLLERRALLGLPGYYAQSVAIPILGFKWVILGEAISQVVFVHWSFALHYSPHCYFMIWGKWHIFLFLRGWLFVFNPAGPGAHTNRKENKVQKMSKESLFAICFIHLP